MRYSSMLGNFFFDDQVAPSKAKLIRDTVTGQFFAPKPGEAKITDEKTAQAYMLGHSSQVLAAIPFELEVLV